MTMMHTGELVPAGHPAARVETCNIAAVPSLAVVDTPPVTCRGTKRKLAPKEGDVYANQKGMRVLAARNMAAHYD